MLVLSMGVRILAAREDAAAAPMTLRFAFAFLVSLTACNAINSVPGPVDAAAPLDATPDLPRLDANVPEVVADSGCPAPARITPASLPATGFLPPVRVFYRRAVDGDTVRFAIPITGEIDVRMLWVNTEESHAIDPRDNTVFGVQTGNWAMAVMPMVAEYQLAFQANPARPGQPMLDMYGRRLALVFADGELWQTRLVRDGWSAYYTDFGCAPAPVHDALLYAEAEARANRRGIWAPMHPTDYAEVFTRWISTRCRPNPFRSQPYCM
jgi:endonuclease YncB( thermonuclease family)